MTANHTNPAIRIRFYASLEAALVAWAAMVLAVGGTFALAGLPLYVVTLVGMLAILAAAMKHPAYRLVKGGR